MDKRQLSVARLFLLVACLTICLPQLGFAQTQAAPTHCSVEKTDEPLPYPVSLKGSGIQGKVILQVVIGEDGCTESVKIVRKLHSELDQIAMQAVSSWKFQPALKDGKPVKIMVQVAAMFKDTSK